MAAMRLSPVARHARNGALVTALLSASLLATCASIGNGGVTRARLVYVDDAVMFRSTLTEAMLTRAGCTYTSDKPAAMRALHEVLARHPFDRTPRERGMNESRYALYLDQADGSTSTLLLDRQYNGPPVRLGTLDGQPIAVDGSLAPELVQWAVDAGIPQSNHSCPAQVPRKAR
jgi:hypothetical protein